LQIIDALKIQREIIMNIFNLQSMILSNQMNAFMKKLTALALIIMVPTLISGIYGMNVSNLPFATSSWSFLFVFGFMILITGTIFFAFKKQDWL
jgi:magnesium transporter